MDSSTYNPILNIVMIVVLFLVFFYIIWVEKKDIYCPKISSTEEECEVGDGMAYNGSRPEEGDSCEKLKERIRIASSAERKAVKWRRAFIIACIATFMLWGLLLSRGKIPDWNLVYLTMLIIFVVIYGNFSYYSFHVFATPEKYTNQALDMMDKCR